MASKSDIVAKVADQTGLTKAKAGDAVNAVFEAIASSLKEGHDVRLIGFGTFAVSKRKASTGRNPATGAEITIRATNQAKFRAGKSLRDGLKDDGWGGPRKK